MTGLLLLMATSTWCEVDRNMSDTRGELQYIGLCVTITNAKYITEISD